MEDATSVKNISTSALGAGNALASRYIVPLLPKWLSAYVKVCPEDPSSKYTLYRKYCWGKSSNNELPIVRFARPLVADASTVRSNTFLGVSSYATNLIVSLDTSIGLWSALKNLNWTVLSIP